MTRSTDISYYTFWPVLSFSYFIATGVIVGHHDINQVHGPVYATLLVFKTTGHLFALMVLILSLVEIFIVFGFSSEVICKRFVYLEINAFMSSLILWILYLLEICVEFVEPHETISNTTNLTCQLIPWCVCFILCVAQVIDTLRRCNVIKFT